MNKELKKRIFTSIILLSLLDSNVFLFIYNDWFNDDYSNNYMD